MTNAKNTKKALLLSVLSLLVCFSMLLGTTFAWFTDSVTSSNNVIKSGNLDIELEYWNGTAWVDVEGKSDILTNTLWEPGVVEVAYLRVANAGSLALKYQLGINIVSETAGVNVAGETLTLSNYIQFGVVEGVNGKTDAYADRDAAVADVTGAKKISAGYTKASSMTAGQELYLALVVYMPTTVGNEANHDGTNVPKINLGINVFATQAEAESEEDGFGTDYDEAAPIISNSTARPEAGSGSDTTPVVLNGLDEVTVTLPGELVDALPPEIEEFALAVAAPKMDSTANTITFPSIEVLDQNGDVIDLEALNTGVKITVTIPAQTMFAPGATVMIYHDGEYIATATVDEDKTITYDVEHLCEVTVGAPKAPAVNEEEKVIQIGTAAELMWFAESVNAGNDYKGMTVVLTDDIDLNNVAWTPIGTNAHPLRANFDGNGKTISNINVETEGWAGLIGHAGLSNGITIKNLTVKNVTINSNRMAGAIVGQLYGSIDNCHVENVTINVTPNADGESYDNGDKVGGIVGWIGDNGNNRTLTNCTATNVTLAGYRDIGGIAGYVASSTTVANNTVTNYTITADQTVNFYGEKDVNAGAILGRVNGTITTENNVAAGEESKIATTYYKNGVILKASSDKEGITLYLVPETYEGTTLNVPEGVTTIGNYAFAYNSNVETVILSSTVRDLGRGFDSSAVKKVVLNEGLEIISSRAFRSTTALEEVVISSTVKEIADNAFQKTALKEIVIPANVQTIGETAFGASLIETVTFEGDIEIQGYAFRGCTKLSAVTMKGDANFVKSTLNGRNSCWFCNGESNNPNTSNITFTVISEEVKEKVLTAMGAERNNTPVIVDDGFVKVETVEALLEALASAATEGGKINATGVVTSIRELGVVNGNYTTLDMYAGTTIKGATISFETNTPILTHGEGEIVFENCTFLAGSFNYEVYFQSGSATAKIVFNNCTFAAAKVIVADNTGAGVEYNNCTFNLNDSGYGLVQAMGGNHTFNNCSFNISGSKSIGSSPITKYGQLNLYCERYSTVVTLNQCVNVPSVFQYKASTGTNTVVKNP